MIGNDDIGESRQVNHTPAIALGVAAVLLLIVGALSYSVYVEDKFEEEYAEKERQLLMRHGYPVNTYPGTQPAVAPGYYPPQRNQNQVAQQGNQSAPSGGTTAPASNPALAQTAAQMNIESGLPTPQDPEIASIQNSLNQVREQAKRTDQRYRDITSDVDTLANEAANSAAEITEELPDFLREAVQDPPGGNPELEARLSRMRDQVMRAPSLAKVTGYDKDWGIVTFDAGAAQNVKKDQRFAVRRGAEILGWIKVDEVQANQSIAVLVTKNASSDTAAKPEVGDDLIDFELF